MKRRFDVRSWNWKQWATAGGIAFGLYLILGIVLAGGGVAPLPPSSVPIKINGGIFTAHRITTPSWTFDYDSAQLAPDAQSGTIEGIHNGVIYRKGKPYLTISAQKITLDTQSMDFTAVGKVHVQTIGGKEMRSFDTDLVNWTNDAKLLHMDHPAYFHSGKQTLRIDGITVDFDEETFHLGKMNGGVDLHK